MNPLKLFRVSVLIPSTRQAMSAYIMAESAEEAKAMYAEILPVKENVVVDEMSMEKGIITFTSNDRDVYLKYFSKDKEKDNWQRDHE